MMSEYGWKPINVCPNCGGVTGVEGSVGKCQFCGTEISKVVATTTTIPSERPVDNLSMVTKDDYRNDPEKIALKTIVTQLLPETAIFEDPKAYLAKRAKGKELDLDSPAILNREIIKEFKHCEDAFLEAYSNYVSKIDLPYLERFQLEYALVMRLQRWLISRREAIHQVLLKTSRYMNNEHLEELSATSYLTKNKATLNQLTDAFDPEAKVNQILLSVRSTLAHELNNFFMSVNSRWFDSGKEWIHPRAIVCLRDHCSEISSPHIAEIRTLLFDLSDQNRFPYNHWERMVTGGTVWRNTSEESTDRNNRMTRTDRLLELLYDPETLPFAIQILKDNKEPIDTPGIYQGERSGFTTEPKRPNQNLIGKIKRFFS